MGKAKITIWHNNRCAKSREAMCVLDEQHAEVTVINYLTDTLTEDMLNDLLQKLNISAAELVRTKEPLFKEKFAGKKMTEKQWVKVLVKFPVLIERPIVVKGKKAVIGRPVENVMSLF
ncbi:MAG: arsenate reductase (glutaredoxin) [Bacteroidia bacterium]|jgi:arsenate reductase|nr:arsenate reductase (glutaredoxin) [Bacteroidia bacterium]